MGSYDNDSRDIYPTPNLPGRDPVDSPLLKPSSLGKGGLRAVNLPDVVGELHDSQTRHSRRTAQVKNARFPTAALSGRLRLVGKSAIQDRYDRLLDAFKAARAEAGRVIGTGRAVSQNAVAAKLKTLGEGGATQRTVGRFINDTDQYPRVDTFLKMLAAVPEIHVAFDSAYVAVAPEEAEKASWSRIAHRLAQIMDVDAGQRLADALEDLHALGAFDTSWPHLRRAAIDARLALSKETEEEATQKKVAKRVK